MAVADLAAPAGPHLPDAHPLDPVERIARLRLARSRNVGPRTYMHLIRRYGSASAAIEVLPDLATRGGNASYQPFPADKAEAECESGVALGAELHVLGDPSYPPLLAAIDTPPAALWVMGDPRIFARPAIAIVGARNASAMGLRTARNLARDLGGSGSVVVSGLARGIDAAAHEASLETGTIAVLAGGIDRIYPPENGDLARRIAESGALVSECPMGVEPTGRHFPKRNRLIAGLASGVVLVEAASRSGSLITARYALDQGREVMACPGAAEDPRAGGCNALIRDGAALVRHAADVLDALGGRAGIGTRALGLAEEGTEFRFDAERFSEEAEEDEYDALADFDPDGADADMALAEQVVRLLGPSPVDVDELARACGTSSADLSLVLLELDLAGRIEMHGSARVSLAAPVA